MNVELYLKALEVKLNALIQLKASSSEVGVIEQKIDDLIYYLEVKK